jgi:hypothetical protein
VLVGHHAKRASEEAQSLSAMIESLKSTDLPLFIQEQKKVTRAIMNHAGICREWVSNRSKDRREELSDLREERREAIFEKLEELGFDRDTESGYETLGDHRLVNQPRPLTTRTWIKIKPTLLEFMQNCREEWIKKVEEIRILNRQRIFAEAFEDYCCSRPSSEAMFGVIDAYLMGKNKSIVEDSASEITKESFADFFDLMPELVENWRKEKSLELLPIISPQLAKSDPAQILGLATTFFKCTNCFQPISYPRILGHACLTKSPPHIGVPEPYKLCLALGSGPWNYGNYIQSYPAAYTSARAVVVACGFDPETATAQELDDANISLECPITNFNGEGRLIMGWRRAVIDGIDKELQLSISTERAPTVLDLVNEDGYYDGLLCSTCGLNMPLLKQHLRTE